MDVKLFDGMFQVCTDMTVTASRKFSCMLWLNKARVQKLDLRHSPSEVAVNTTNRHSNIVHQALQRSAYTFWMCSNLYFIDLQTCEGGLPEGTVCIWIQTVTDMFQCHPSAKQSQSYILSSGLSFKLDICSDLRFPAVRQ